MEWEFGLHTGSIAIHPAAVRHLLAIVHAAKNLVVPE
jgi:hypothetical protein